jgi:hypothetical protein
MKLTESQKQKLRSDTFHLVKRHGWEPFAEAVESACHGIAGQHYFSEWIWNKRAAIIRRARHLPSSKRGKGANPNPS